MTINPSRVAHRVTRDAAWIHKWWSVKDTDTAIESFMQAHWVHHICHYGPNPIPSILPKHLHLPQLVKVLYVSKQSNRHIKSYSDLTESSVKPFFVKGMFQFMSTCIMSKSNISSLETTNGQLLVSLKLFKRSFCLELTVYHYLIKHCME